MTRAIVFLFLFSFTKLIQAAPEEILFWHSMSGQIGKTLNIIIENFNQQQHNYNIKPIYKGNYNELLTSFTAAFRAHKAPHIVQVFEIGFSLMTNAPGVIIPVDDLMHESNLKLSHQMFFTAVLAYYSKNNKLQAMPFNLSVPVIFFNKSALQQININENNFPKTWSELEILAEKLNQKGFSCVYTSANPAWIFIESFSAIHGLSLINQEKTAVLFNNKYIVKHLNRLRRWQKLKYFEYGGREDDATTLFTSGRCPLFSQSLGAFQSLAKTVSFPVGIAAIPLDTSFAAERFNNVVGGGALWVIAGHEQKQYQGVALFLKYISNIKIQQEWHNKTGYLSLNPASGELDFPSRLALNELNGHHHPGIQSPFAGQTQVRHINDEAIESIFAQLKSPQMALYEAETKSNRVVLRWQKILNGLSP